MTVIKGIVGTTTGDRFNLTVPERVPATVEFDPSRSLGEATLTVESNGEVTATLNVPESTSLPVSDRSAFYSIAPRVDDPFACPVRPHRVLGE